MMTVTPSYSSVAIKKLDAWCNLFEIFPRDKQILLRDARIEWCAEKDTILFTVNEITLEDDVVGFPSPGFMAKIWLLLI